MLPFCWNLTKFSACLFHTIQFIKSVVFSSRLTAIENSHNLFFPISFKFKSVDILPTNHILLISHHSPITLFIFLFNSNILSNLISKSILDSLNGLAYQDDKLICELEVKKFYAEQSEVKVKLMEV